ncbi:MAG: OPT/YSL family transporter, partial [Planctomycetota bacterium]
MQDSRHPPFETEREAARWWLDNVYAGDDAVQLSPRAVITGMIIGGVMSISNLYVGLKTGWGLGVTITACIIAFAVFKFLEAVVPAYRDKPFTTLENYTMSSAASAAGYMSSAGLVSALPALYMTTGRLMQWWEIMLWLGALSLLGVFMAIPLKRQLINIDQLPFPSGIATAETLRSIHSAGGEAVVKARALLAAAIVGATVALWRDLFAAVKALAAYAFPAELPFLPTALGRDLLAKYT